MYPPSATAPVSPTITRSPLKAPAKSRSICITLFGAFPSLLCLGASSHGLEQPTANCTSPKWGTCLSLVVCVLWATAMGEDHCREGMLSPDHLACTTPSHSAIVRMNN